MIEQLKKEERDVKLKVNSLLSKKHKHECLFPECNKASISSHSISKSVLKPLLKNNHIISPQFNRAKCDENSLRGKEINLSFKEIGLDKASTFKGFCSEHDNNVFSNIDNRGIVTNRDIFLQLYRSANKFFFTDKQINNAEIDVLGYEYETNTEYDSNLIINLEKIIFLINDLLVDFPELDQIIHIKKDDTLSIKPFSKKINIDVEITYKKLNFVIPVAMEKCFKLHLDNEHSESLIIITPSKDHTNIIILCHPNITPQYLKEMRSEIRTLNLIESILMQDSDFYLTPSVFDGWDEEKKEVIINDFYFYNERKFLEEYELSIFDDVREKLCFNLSEEKRVHELKKIYSKPQRDPIEVRNNRLWSFTNKGRQAKILLTGNTTGACYPIDETIFL